MSTTAAHKANQQIIKINNSQRGRASAPRNASANESTAMPSPSKSALTTKRSCRITTREMSETETRLRFGQPTTQLTEYPRSENWKHSKLFSKTLSTIEVSKNSKYPTSSSIKTESQIAASNVRTNSFRNEKSKIETSTLDHSSTPTSSSTAGKARKISEWKTIKSKLNLLRRRENAHGNVESLLNCKENSRNSVTDENEASGSSLKDTPSQLSSDKPSIFSNESSESTAIGKSSNNQNEGVVWKMQDLMFLIAQTHKLKTRAENNRLKNNSQDPSSIVNLGSLNENALKVQPDEDAGDVKGSCNCEDLGSEVCRSNSCDVVAHKSQKKTGDDTVSSEVEKEAKRSGDKKASKQIEDESKENHNELVNESVELTDGKRNRVDQVKESDEQMAGTSSATASTTVQWDEANFVDPMLLGDAIQNFLKGLNNVPAPEKRVSFKKNC